MLWVAYEGWLKCAESNGFMLPLRTRLSRRFLTTFISSPITSTLCPQPASKNTVQAALDKERPNLPAKAPPKPKAGGGRPRAAGSPGRRPVPGGPGRGAGRRATARQGRQGRQGRSAPPPRPGYVQAGVPSHSTVPTALITPRLSLSTAWGCIESLGSVGRLLFDIFARIRQCK